MSMLISSEASPRLERSEAIARASTPQAGWKSRGPYGVKIWSHLAGNRKQPFEGGAESRSEMQLCSIYGLYSSEDGVVRYVGQTVQGLVRRKHQHIADAKRIGKSHVHRWIRKVLRDGHQLGICLLEADVPIDEAEVRWIEDFRQKYPGVMTNIANGGGGQGLIGLERSAATRAKMRKPKSKQHRINMRGPKSAETKKKMSLSQMGNHKSAGEANCHAKLTAANVIDIKHRLNVGQSLSQIAQIYGVQKAAISKIRTGRNWSSISV